jgi:hypothetical protein
MSSLAETGLLKTLLVEELDYTWIRFLSEACLLISVIRYFGKAAIASETCSLSNKKALNDVRSKTAASLTLALVSF